jgi:hypothetical protein
VAGGKGGDFGGEKISEKAIAVIEAEIVPVVRLKVGSDFHHADFSFCVRGFSGNDRSSGTISKEAGADENAWVVIEIRSGGTDLHADDEGVFRLAGSDQRRGLAEGGESGSATQPDQIEKGKRRVKAENLGDVTG